LENVIIEDGQRGIARQTSVDCCEPVNFLVLVHLVTRRAELKCVVTARVCNASYNKENVVMAQVEHIQQLVKLLYNIGKIGCCQMKVNWSSVWLWVWHAFVGKTVF